MKDIPNSPDLVAHCGLYCGACGAYLRGRCPGCQKNESATWCKVRACCREHGRRTCAACIEVENPKQCGKFHNFFSRVFGFIFRSDRAACIRQVKYIGIPAHAADMAGRKRQSIPPGSIV